MYFTVDSNSLTGSIPEGLLQLTKLSVLWMNDNSLTGTIADDIGDLVHLISLDLSSNSLSRTIPASLGALPRLQDLALQANALTGTMPRLLSYELELLFVQRNQLSGSMKEVVWNPADSRLAHIDLSSNLFSGEVCTYAGYQLALFPCMCVCPLSLPPILTMYVLLCCCAYDLPAHNMLLRFVCCYQVPAEFFALPSIISIAMSVNCLAGRLPTAMCAAENIEVLSLDGLGAADHCRNNYPSPFSSRVRLYNTMQGALPECVWGLPKLATLHVAGNGG